MKLICDLSFVEDYIKNFYSNVNRDSANIVNKSISPFLQGNPILVISLYTIEKLNKLYPERKLILDTFFGLCEKSDIDFEGKIEVLIKMAAIYEIQDKETYIVSDDDYIIQIVNKTSHKAISIKTALEKINSS